MSLTWRDAVGTLLVAAVAIITYAKMRGLSWLMFDSWRWVSLLVLLIGFAACIVISGNAIPAKNNWTTLAATLGGLSFVFGMGAIIFNNQVLFLLLSGGILLLWAITTLHHIVTTNVA